MTGLQSDVFCAAGLTLPDKGRTTIDSWRLGLVNPIMVSEL